MSALRTEDKPTIARWLSAVCPDEETLIISKPSSRRYREDDASVKARFEEATSKWAALAPMIVKWRIHCTVIVGVAVDKSVAKMTDENALLRGRLRSLGEDA